VAICSPRRDQQAARLAGHRLNGGKHRVDARRGEQIATDCGGADRRSLWRSVRLAERRRGAYRHSGGDRRGGLPAIKPTCAGSWPAPPPEITATLFLFRSRRTTTRIACGDLFASPSVDAVLTAIQAVTGEAGCLLIVKNYTGCLYQ
jgi:hypothetical protein